MLINLLLILHLFFYKKSDSKKKLLMLYDCDKTTLPEVSSKYIFGKVYFHWGVYLFIYLFTGIEQPILFGFAAIKVQLRMPCNFEPNPEDKDTPGSSMGTSVPSWRTFVRETNPHLRYMVRKTTKTSHG